jgi:hypothetical protein
MGKSPNNQLSLFTFVEMIASLSLYVAETLFSQNSEMRNSII